MNFSMNDTECLKIQMGSELIILLYFLVDKAFLPNQGKDYTVGY